MKQVMPNREEEFASEHAQYAGDDESEQERPNEQHTHAAEYARLIVMAAVILASLSGWWRHWMSRDWLAFATTLIGGFPISPNEEN
jgi:uncharacterized membrane protein YcjF (UPF0283 family)